jgi:carbon storage regulator CsrA
MLVLTRRIDEALFIGPSVRVIITAVCGNKVRLGITAPRGVRVLRAELGTPEGESLLLPDLACSP